MAHGKNCRDGWRPGSKTLLQIQIASLKSKGQVIDPAEEKKLLDKIRGRYEEQTNPYYAAARLWVDGIIDPLETRKFISEGIKAANQNPEMTAFKTGVFQV
jgi:acetyl-CoA carboxylase carboxyltransferase component